MTKRKRARRREAATKKTKRATSLGFQSPASQTVALRKVDSRGQTKCGSESIIHAAVLEAFDLAFKVFFFVRGTDPGVDDRFLEPLAAIVTKAPEDVIAEVEPLASGESFVGNSVRLSMESGAGDGIRLSDVFGGQVRDWEKRRLGGKRQHLPEFKK